MISAAEMRGRLAQLSLERDRAIALRTGDTSALDEEIEACRSAFVGTAVTEIAVLRASFDGPNEG